MSTGSQLSPLPAAERIDALDVLRGFALLGIFLMNSEFFSRPLQDIDGEGIDSSLRGLDDAADALVYFFVQSKFWTLFSLLFGMGFAVMIERADQAGRAFVPVYLRRSLALLAIGVVHALLLWSGDILISYALCALVLLLLRQLRRGYRRKQTPDGARSLPAAALIRWGIALYSLPLLLLLVAAGLGALAPNPAPSADRAAEHAALRIEQVQAREQAERAYRDGGYVQAVEQRLRDTRWQLGTLPAFGVLILGIFVLGAGLLRSGALAAPEKFSDEIRLMRNLGLPLGFALMAVSVTCGTSLASEQFGPREAVMMSSYLAAGLVLALAYAASLLLALQGALGPWLRTWLAPAGRMALSNYLLQSLLATLVFYGYGLGLWGQVPRALQLLGVLVIFAVQAWLSRCWLNRYRFGPVEWLWRAATYLRWPALR